ncbi:MAG: zinc ribbon domain-containing protein [Candidatus Hodarchaeales archaeon]|jgi:hypothetical protein
MNNPFDQISGQFIINGRAYSAKEVIRGLLEQGIAINEGSEGLKIGFKHFSPQTSTSQDILEGNGAGICPFIPYMSQITSRLDDLSSRMNSQHNTDIPHSKSTFVPTSPENSEPPFSPFKLSSFDSRSDNETFVHSSSSFFDAKQKCSSCGAPLPQNAFFCNKCGNHVRSG